MEAYTEYFASQILNYINTIKDSLDIESDFNIKLTGTSSTSSRYIASEINLYGQEIQKEYVRNNYTVRYEITQNSPVINFNQKTLFKMLKSSSTDFSNNIIKLFDLVKNALNINIDFKNLIIDIQEYKIIITITMIF